MFLRLQQQAQVLAGEGDSVPDYRQSINDRIPPSGPAIPLNPGRLSPVGSSSPLAFTVLRALSSVPQGGSAITQDDMHCLDEAVRMALENGSLVTVSGRKMGGDEVLFGRAGLLWAILNLRMHHLSGSTSNSLHPGSDVVSRLLDVIIAAGRQGSEDYTKQNGTNDSLPLMYVWMEGYYGFGA